MKKELIFVLLTMICLFPQTGKVGILSFKTVGGVSSTEKALLEGMLIKELEKQDELEILAENRMIREAASAGIRPDCYDTICASNLAAALELRYVIYATVSKPGGSYMMMGMKSEHASVAKTEDAPQYRINLNLYDALTSRSAAISDKSFITSSDAAVVVSLCLKEMRKSDGPTAKLEIKTQPGKAALTLNGEVLGVSPLQADISAGKHVLEVKKTGYRSEILEFSLAAGETYRETVILQTGTESSRKKRKQGLLFAGAGSLAAAGLTFNLLGIVKKNDIRTAYDDYLGAGTDFDGAYDSYLDQKKSGNIRLALGYTCYALSAGVLSLSLLPAMRKGRAAVDLEISADRIELALTF